MAKCVDMSLETDLPEDVLAAIRAGSKIEAIKLLRQHRGVGLKDAKGAVDAYIRDHPGLNARSVVRSDPGLGRLLLLALAIAVLYLAYRYLSPA
jgi:hypothetical protein